MPAREDGEIGSAQAIRASMHDWFLSRSERGNPATSLDDRRAAGQAFSSGNLVRPLIHGATYFAELTGAVRAMHTGDLLLFVDWRGDPDEQLVADPGSTVGALLRDAARRGVDVRGLVWRSHLDRFAFSARENRHLGEEIDAAGGQCLLDMRVRFGGSHHQKFVVLRHPGRPEQDVAFVGGIDLCHSRRDNADHAGDRQRQPMAAVYGDRPPWHDIQVAITGPAVADVETVFRERWDDRQPLSRNPVHLIADRVRHDDIGKRKLPGQLPDPPEAGPHSVQLLRTYPRRRGGYPFAPDGERSVARGYRKAFAQARDLIYLEDQYLWSITAARAIAAALRARPRLHFVAVLPLYPDQDGRWSMPPNLLARAKALDLVRNAAPERVGVYGLENAAGTPIYVHAKACVIDDVWAGVGSDNVNRRSWTHDSELSVAVWDDTLADPSGTGADPSRLYPQQLRLTLAREHLARADGDDADLRQAAPTFRAFRDSANALNAWVHGGRAGARPPGQLRPIEDPGLSWRTKLWATPLYRTVFDPDGRPRRMRRADEY
ncbi:MAG: phospholipase D-like domain-containing protein [Jatrophihabitantaceae bacterium]